MPSPTELEELYSKDYYESYVEGPGIAGGSDELAPYLRKRLNGLTRYFGQGRILDFGCAEGLFVAHARDSGWDSYGVEMSSWAADRGRQRFGVRIFETQLADAPIPQGSLDVVHTNHVLEHLPDPVGVMRAAYTLLRPGGMLVAEVPQELSVPLVDAMLGRLRPAQTLPPSYHVVFFSRRGLELAAKRAGFEVKAIDNLRHIEVLRRRSLPFALLRRCAYFVERLLRRGPVYVLVARRPLA